jgi:hypothetical protein
VRPPDEKTDVLEGVEYRYRTGWIHKLEDETHWRLYWHQLKLMEGLMHPSDTVLEIGPGTGFTANYLRSKGVVVDTLDIDADKKPDIVANIVGYEFPAIHDAILAFEVFEHIPYDGFRSVLSRFSGAARHHVFLSVPRNRRVVFGFRLKLPKLASRSFELKAKKGRIVEPYHIWEVDHGGITVHSLEAELARHGLRIERRDEAFERLFYALAPLTVSEGGS